MRITDFDIYKNLLKEKSGLIITPDKAYLLESRLNPVAKKWGYPSLDAMTVALNGIPDKALVIDIVEAMTTNETSFFRDIHPFDLFKTFVVPEVKKDKGVNKSLKLWCAAASSGQEPYSISMILKELEAAAELSGWMNSIIATDLSLEILAQAREGLYSQFEVQRGLPIMLLMKYFTQEGEKWRVSDKLKQMIKYQAFNLLDSMTGLGKFDVIFCRNVLIYFDAPTKGQILDRMAAQLEPHGFLFLGGAETVIGITESFRPVPGKRGIYVPKNSRHLTAPAAAGAKTA